MNLKQCLQQEMAREFLKAGNNAMPQVIMVRVILNVFDEVNYSVDKFFELRNQIHVHRDSMKMIDHLWKESSQKIIPPGEDTTFVQKFTNRDFVKSHEVCKLFNVLSKKLHRQDIRRLLAIDGLKEEDFKHYVKNLKYSPLTEKCATSVQELHVRAIRKLYASFPNLEPGELKEILLTLYNEETPPEDSEVANAYLESVGEHMTSIAGWKLGQKSKPNGGQAKVSKSKVSKLKVSKSEKTKVTKSEKRKLSEESDKSKPNEMKVRKRKDADSSMSESKIDEFIETKLKRGKSIPSDTEIIRKENIAEIEGPKIKKAKTA